MNITISGKHIDLTPSLKAYVEEKVERLEHLHFDIERVRVELDVDHHHQKGVVAKVVIEVITKAKTLYVDERASEMHAAIDLALPKIERQIRRLKGILSQRDRSESDA